MEAFDLSRTSDIPAWLKSVVNAVGPLSGLVHCAGVQATSPVKFVTGDAAEALLRTNLLSSIMLMRAFSQRGCRTAESSVVLISSVIGLTGSPATSVYGASKAALIGFAKSLAVELAPERVRVNCIAPGFVQTEMLEEVREFFSPEQFEALGRAHPLGIGCPRDVANAAAFLLAGTGRWITGTTLVVDGGYTAH
jgi:NAD(P)-dependent dehydrogenase (short-subunit alcohol dehydrogenase family)